ncbi:anti-anti-sigma regulatory factor, SpoIIAA [Hathewaya proteolytica DSM 3090]|uniref:Anti-sigma F factor antagonist n=1 Tax=Hathewaya proteolytica DSM 3090 TaxID=1121331 RepID=A0A1M6PA37_9CLOT|nr:anti-sigma F factor antagonist [Hathewaya proteolytica]SHK04831.1 anti-anti-sigma regulatory factor, SpoIIAA [Hathewaya proteolytica DSM 3090]
MELRFEKKQDVLIIRMYGELDHHTCEEVRNKLDDRIEREKVKKVILDFRAITFMDSSGIGVIIGRYKKINQSGGKICVAEATGTVEKVFMLSGMNKIIDIYTTVDNALEKLS